MYEGVYEHINTTDTRKVLTRAAHGRFLLSGGGGRNIQIIYLSKCTKKILHHK